MISVTICSLKRADAHLAASNFDALLSIGAPGGTENCVRRTPNNLLLNFWDMCPNVDRKKALPPTTDIVAMIRWAKALNNDDLVLVHCKQGRSRSTASAIILYLAQGASEEDAVRWTFDVAPRSQPNWYLLTVADQLLQTNVLGFMRENGWALKKTRKDIII